MAVYKIFPEKDATLYSQYPTENTGLDEILEISTVYNNQIAYASRPVIKFNQSELTDIINNKISGNQWQSNLKLFLAYASNIPLEYTLQCYPIYSSWNMGTGHYSDNPITTDGVSWTNTQQSGSGTWSVFPYEQYVTSSYPLGNIGGGDWYYQFPDTSIPSSQTFNYASSKDINFDVTGIVNLFASGSIINNGFLIKKDDSLEFSTTDPFELKYFSIDTHTIYPPCLEFKWNDFTTVLTGSLTSSILSNSDFKLTLPNNPGYFYSGSIAKIRVNSRPKYPNRTFSTSSIYTTNYFLPTQSYWAIKDLDTNEYVVDFDTTYTKISADSTSNYFKVYMNGLEPERYYKFLIKTVIDGQTIISDNNYYFKVING
jgi:hypothetical protein